MTEDKASYDADPNKKWKCHQASGITSSGGDPEPIDTSVPYVLLHEVPPGRVVIRRHDARMYQGNTRWIVYASSLVPWETLAYVELAAALGITERKAKFLWDKIQDYNNTAKMLDTIMTKITSLVAPYNKEAHVGKMQEIVKHVLAGTPLDKLLTDCCRDLSLTILQHRNNGTLEQFILNQLEEENRNDH